MGIVVGIAAEVAIEAAAEAAAQAAAEAGAEAAAETAAAAAAEGAAEAAGEAAAETVADVAAESGEEAGEQAAEEAVDKAVEEAAGKGASKIVKKVIKAAIVASMIEELIRNTIKIVDTLEAKDRIKTMLKLLDKAMKDAKTNLKQWNDQITAAIKKGKLRKVTKLPDGLKMSEGLLFSSEMNTEVENFLAAIQPSVINVAGVAKKKDVGKIEDAVKKAKDAFMKASGPFLTTVKTWDSKDTDIKSQAGINFQVAQLEANINAVKTHDA
eukprot:scpid92686/ scgid9150/ 